MREIELTAITSKDGLKMRFTFVAVDKKPLEPKDIVNLLSEYFVTEGFSIDNKDNEGLH